MAYFSARAFICVTSQCKNLRRAYRKIDQTASNAIRNFSHSHSITQKFESVAAGSLKQTNYINKGKKEA